MTRTENDDKSDVESDDRKDATPGRTALSWRSSDVDSSVER